jgi:hypothetical protein
MKKAVLIMIAAQLVALSAFSQITLNNTFTVSTNGGYGFYFSKLGLAGYKYVIHDNQAKTLVLYNTNNTVYKTIPIPSSITTGYYVGWLSDDLFNLNANVEYALVTYGTVSKVHIFDETGALLFSRDSANLGNFYDVNPVMSQSGIFRTPNGVKMRIMRYANATGPLASSYELYDLPGNLPCQQCSATGTVLGISTSGEVGEEEALFYPNPAQHNLKLKYELPAGSRQATIEILDVTGKKIESMEVTNNFSHILLPADYNSGLYFYALYVDGKLVKTEKVVLQH